MRRSDSFPFSYRVLKDVDIDAITRFSAGVEGEVMRDVVRTYQQVPLFQEGHTGRPMLVRILLAVARAADASVGYCQGMNFVAGALVQACVTSEEEVTLNDHYRLEVESRCFELLLLLIEREGKLSMMGLWAERIPRLKLRVYQLDRLLRWYCPQLHKHFADIELSPEVIQCISDLGADLRDVYCLEMLDDTMSLRFSV